MISLSKQLQDNEGPGRLADCSASSTAGIPPSQQVKKRKPLYLGSENNAPDLRLAGLPPWKHPKLQYVKGNYKEKHMFMQAWVTNGFLK